MITQLFNRGRQYFCVAIFLSTWLRAIADDGLRVSVYATAGDVLRYLAKADDRDAVAQACGRLRVSRIFLEGRRGDEYVSPSVLSETRDFFETKGIQACGGIATVPGANFGKRQNEALGWLNWENEKTRRDVARFFTENAPVFRDLIVDDFFCTADTSPESDRARGVRSWPAYRRDLMVSCLSPLIVQPAREARPAVQLILKFPQWYDRFHLFGYDPSRMMAPFNQIWVGTEVRNPQTRRMGFVQPTEGYMNFRWLASQGGEKVVGAWFDHIECSAQNFVDQAYGSVLAGARELTLFHLGDLMENHPGDALLASHLPELIALEKNLHGQHREGIPFYKPSGSESEENLYLADYLGMIGLPMLPVAQYPENAKVAFLPVQAASDPEITSRMRQHLARGGTLVLTPALVRRLGSVAARLAGVEISPESRPASATAMVIERQTAPLLAPFELDAGLATADSQTLIEGRTTNGLVPVLTSHAATPGRVLVFNARTFSESDFRQTGEWLLAPRTLGISVLPQTVVDSLRESLLTPLGIRFAAPSAVSLCLAGQGFCLCNFRDQLVEIRLNGERLQLRSNQCLFRRNLP